MDSDDADRDQPVVTSASVWRSPRWLLTVVISTNALIVPLAIPVVVLEGIQPLLIRYILGPLLMGMLFADVFLLAIWMSLGGWPRSGRSLLLPPA